MTRNVGVILAICLAVQLVTAGNVPCQSDYPGKEAFAGRGQDGNAVLAVKRTTTSAPTNWFDCNPKGFEKGTCCYDCRLPTYVSNGKTKNICTCSGKSELRFSALPHCYPYQTVNMTSNDDSAGFVGRAIFKACVAIGCNCTMNALLPNTQQIKTYPGAHPPLGSLSDEYHYNQYKSVTANMLLYKNNGTITADAYTQMLKVTDKLYSYYTMNGVGNLVATKCADVLDVANLASTILALDNYQWSNIVTTTTNKAYENVIKYAVVETYRFIGIYRLLSSQQAADVSALDATLPAKIASALTAAENTLKSFY